MSNTPSRTEKTTPAGSGRAAAPEDGKEAAATSRTEPVAPVASGAPGDSATRSAAPLAAMSGGAEPRAKGRKSSGVTLSDQRNALPVGYEFDGYRVESVLGSGGFGITYKATELSISRAVAIKEFLPAGMAWRDSEDYSVHAMSDLDTQTLAWGRSSFQREAETLVNFRHENVVSVLRFFEANGTAYMVMDYEEGESLSRILDGGALDQSEMEEVLYPLLNALEEIHKKGFLHRDIKPSNIYIRRDGTPVLLDFGAAKEALGERSHSLNVVLTPPYAPMEQYSGGEALGPWTDIYAMAITAYVCCSDAEPPDAMARSNAVMGGRGDPMKPAADVLGKRVDTAFAAAIDYGARLLQEDRPQTVAEWRRCFREGVAPEATQILGVTSQIGQRRSERHVPTRGGTPAVGMAGRAAGVRPRSRAWPIAAGVAALFAVAGVGYAGYKHMDAGDQSQKLKDLQARLTSMSLTHGRTTKSLTDARTRLAGAARAQAARARANMAAASEIIDYAAKYRANKERADQHHKAAQHQYFDRRDRAAAFRLYLAAAQLGHAEAQALVGYMYYVGQGVKKDLKQAFLWYRRSAELGNATARTTLAHLYTLGEGVRRNYAQAIIWAGRAVVGGSVRGYCHLGNLYRNGYGVGKDEQAAFRYFLEGAKRRDVWCMFEIGRAYEQGAGVARNRAQALHWYRQSAERGYPQAKEALRRLQQ